MKLKFKADIMARKCASSADYTKLGIVIMKQLPEFRYPKKIVITYIWSPNGWRYEVKYSPEYLKWHEKLARIKSTRSQKKHFGQDREDSSNRVTTLMVSIFRHLSSAKTML